MDNEIIEQDYLSQDLKKMQICRFCLSRNRLSSIFVKPGNASTLAPLTVQVMACASIEIFNNDGLPSLICQDCRLTFEHSYRFKQMCKRADTLLRQYPLTGKIPDPLNKPKIPLALLASATASKVPPQSSQTTVTKVTVPTNSGGGGGVKKILNAAPAAAPAEGHMPMRFTFKTEPNPDTGVQILSSVDPIDEISMEDVQKIIANAGDEDFIYTGASTSANSSATKSSPPKLLNKAPSKHTSNIDFNKVETEPQFRKAKMQMNTKGQMELVTAIVQPIDEQTAAAAAADPTKNAELVETDNFPCPFCERSFPLLQLRDIHLTRHNRDRNFQCPDCDKSFFSKYDLQKHEVRHTGEKPFKCTICNKAFTRSTLLHRHEKVHTDVPKFLCIYCEKPFISKNELETHIGRHEKNRPFKCQECGKSFAFKQGLERHEVVHSAVLPYPCQYCDQSFTTPSKLSRHLTAHAGERPFPCKYCKKSYMLSHHLTRHLRSHKQAPVSDYQCNECNKSFKHREDLIYHTAVHSTANLICTLCHKEFQTANDVATHIKMHIDGDAFACEFCDLIFITADELLAHYEKHSTEVEEFKYDTGFVVAKQEVSNKQQPKQKQQRTIIETLDGDDENIIKQVNEIFKSSAKQQQQQELDDDDENIVATIHDILSYDEVNDFETAMNEGTNNNEQQKSPEKPKILNQIVFSSSNIVKDQALETQTPSAKIRKVVTRDGKLELAAAETATSDNQQRKSPRRKMPVKPVEIKIEKEELVLETQKKLPTLPVLPKGVTIRKTTKAINFTVNPSSSDKSSTPPPPPPVAKSENSTQASQSTNGKSLMRALSTRRSGGNTQTETNASSPQSSKAPQPAAKEQKPTKVKQIRMTKAMADELAKQGRIKFKDGNMILTKPSK